MTLARSPLKPGTGFLRSRTRMKSASFDRIATKEATGAAKIKRGMKPSRPKMTPIRASANGEQCTLRFPCCNFNPETTVWCHSNRAEDGKGMGIKARDEEGCYGCSACHAFLDGGYAGHMPRGMVNVHFDIARVISQNMLRQKGLL